MKKLVLVLVVALIAVPVMAAQPITVTGTGGVLSGTVGYSGATQNAKPDAGRPAAFALTLTADGGAKFLTVTPTKTGQGTTGSRGYGIFPGTIDINSSGVVLSDGSPVEPNDLPGAAGTGLNTGTVVVALGSLYQDPNKPAASGNLFSFTTDIACNVTVAVESLYRGGVVGEDAAPMTVTLPSPIVITGLVTETITGTPVVAKTTAAPAIAGRVNAVRSESFTASGVASSLGHALQYQFNWGDGSALVWGAATQTHTFATATTKTWTTNVTVQARCAADTAITSAVSAPIAETGEAVKSTATFYATWADFSRPNCWAYQRNCRGDADGVGGGIGVNKIWVNAADLNVLSAGFNKIVAALKLASYGGVPAVCADTDRAGGGIGVNKIWVNSTDLGTLGLYYNKIVANVPVCIQTNYNYWTN